jgi:E3 ubiquitin-protein ligase SHPRH
MPRVRQCRGALKRDAPAELTAGPSKKRVRPNDYVEHISAWDPQAFYNSVHVPPADLPLWPQLDGGTPAGFLDSKLYPFQRRTVQFMIEREGAKLDCDGDICSPPHAPIGVDGTTVRGGILAEEMGLGKTVELIALISLHRRPAVPKDYPLVAVDGGNVVPRRTSAATLIITPTHLVQQWKDEIALHAPNMRVFQYEGIKRGRGVTSAAFEHCDVVLTTYPVIAAEIWYVNTVQRDLRRAKKYVPPQSPLTEVEWWRVCLDEAQMVESGVSNTALVARLIPRVNAWAVSGTPFKNQVEDLRGLLHFLRYAPYDNKAVWHSIDRENFETIFGTIAIRHTKAMVRHELHLPRQKRLIISVPFMAMEEQNYTALFAAMCKDLGVHTDGTPLNDRVNLSSDHSIGKMRAWLRRLRQTCLHPQVGTKNRRALGDHPLRTVDQVLGAMIKQLEITVSGSERDVVNARIMRGHVHAFDGSNARRAESSLTFYEEALSLVRPIVERCRAEEKTQKSHDDAKDSLAKGMNYGLRMALELSHMAHFFVATANFQIKEVTEKDSDEFYQREAAEKTHYDSAKAIRQELLLESREDSMKTMSRVANAELVPLAEITIIEFSGGIECVKYAHRLEDIIEVLNKQAGWLNKWSERARNILLKPLVDADDKDEDTGEEYADSTKEQDELYILFLALRTIAADQLALVNGNVNNLTRHEAKQALSLAKNKMDDLDMMLKGRKLQLNGDVRGGSLTAEAADDELAIIQQQYNELIETPKLTVDTLREWDGLKGKDDLGSVRGVVLDLRGLLTKLEWQGRNPLRPDITARSGTEAFLVEKLLKFSNDLATKNTKALSDLETKLDLFRNCMNQRLMFYKRLQDISDSVKPWREKLQPTMDEVELSLIRVKQKSAEEILYDEGGRYRFLKHLRDHASEDESRICVICQCPFEVGCSIEVCAELTVPRMVFLQAAGTSTARSASRRGGSSTASAQSASDTCGP